MKSLNRRTATWGLALVFAQGVVGLVPDAPIQCDACEAWNREREPFRIFGNTYYVGVEGLSAVLIASDAGHILLDGGLPQSAPRIDANLRHLGFRRRDIRLIVNSHAHYDHAGGIAALQRLSGATVAASSGNARALEQGLPGPDDPQYGFGQDSRFPAVPEVRIVVNGENLSVGDLVVTARMTPGHTPGSTTWTWRSCEGDRCLDLVYADSLNAVSAPGFRFSGDPTSPSRVEVFRQSIRRVGQLPCDVLISVHPRFSSLFRRLRRREQGDEDALVDPDACKTYAASAAEALEQRIAREASPTPKALSSIPVQAQGQTRADEYRSVQTLDSRQGLSNNSAYRLLQDHQGFLWIGTLDGLNRFDGYSFTIYRHDPSNPHSLSNNTVRQIWEDRWHNLWLGTAAGLDRLDRRTGRFHHYPIDVQHLGADAQGDLLVASSHGLLRYVPEDDSFEDLAAFPLLESESLPSKAGPVTGILAGRDGEIWLSTFAEYLFRIGPNGTIGRVATPWPVLVIVLGEQDGRFWLSHERLVAFDPDSRRFAEIPGTEHIDARVYAAHRDENGDVWIGADRLYRLTPGSGGPAVTVDIGPIEQLSTPIWDITQDREGVLWLGTRRGLKLLDPYTKRFRSHRHDPNDPSTLGGDIVVAVAPDDGGDLWVGTLGGGLNRLDAASGQVRRYLPSPADRHGLCGDQVWAVQPRPDGRVWVGTNGGLCVLDPARDQFDPVALEPNADGAQPVVSVLLVDRSDRLWAGTSIGLFEIAATGSRRVRLPPPAQRPNATIQVQGLSLAGDGALWVGSSESDLYHVDPVGDQVTHYPLGDAKALRGSEGFWAISERSDGRLWLGSDRGLFVFDPESGELETSRLTENLATTPVYAIARDTAGALWLSTNDGLLRYPQPEETDPTRVAVRHYTTADGLPHAEFNRRAVARLGDGSLVFGGMGGVTLFDPAAIRDNPYPPAVVLTSIERQRREGAVLVNPYQLEELVLAPDDTGISFEFSALTFANPARTSYAYRLEGIDADWVQAGSARQARYPALAPGRYRFQVRAANADGVWNNVGSAIKIVVPTPWWASLWFRAVASALALTTLGVVLRHLSTRKLRRQLRTFELERQIHLERERISRDLHDNLGSQVATMVAGIELAQMTARAGDREVVDEQLANLGKEAQRTMEQLHETVWTLHHERVTLAALADQVQEHLRDRQRYLQEPRLDFASAGDLNLELPSSHALHLFRIVQESVSNALRHANATSVQVTLDATTGRQLRVEIRDDGTFQPPAPGHPGLGLAGMRTRAEQIQATFALESVAPTGTAVRIALPVRRPRADPDRA